MESTNAQFTKISLAIFDEISTKAQDLKGLSQREIDHDNMDPLTVLSVIKKNLGELRSYIRTVTSAEDGSATVTSTAFAAADLFEPNAMLKEIEQMISNMKE